MQRIKTLLIRSVGERPTTYIQAVRFVYLLKRRSNPDPEASLLHRFLKPGDVTVDVGANGANWTHWLHEVVGDRGKVFAFEADPYYARATEIAVRIMGMKGVTLFRYGLSDRHESVVLRVTDTRGERLSGLGSVTRSTDKTVDNALVVELRPLDSLLSDFPHLTKARLIKCDTEGYELMVFRGASRLIEVARPVVILEVGRFEEQGYTAHDLHTFFKDRGYVALALVGGTRLARTGADLDHTDACSVNRVLLPGEQVE